MKTSYVYYLIRIFYTTPNTRIVKPTQQLFYWAEILTFY